MRALLAFFTVLPVRQASLEDAAGSAPLLPLVGLLTGLPAAAVVLSAHVLPPGVAATLALGAALLAAGLHHTDGVLDVGDALMVRGSRERRRAVLKDARVGVGGIGALFLVYAPALAALAALAATSPARAALTLLVAEVSARSAMLLTLAFGRPAEAGSSSVPFIRALTQTRRTLGVALALLAPVALSLPLGAIGACAAFSAPIAAFVGSSVSRRSFGGINGDASGATGELARTVLLVAVSVSA